MRSVAACALVVDDDQAVRATTAAPLAEMGYHVLESGRGAEVVEVLEEEQPIHVLLTDVAMPGMTGPELACLGPPTVSEPSDGVHLRLFGSGCIIGHRRASVSGSQGGPAAGPGR